MPLVAGTKLGPYEIRASFGKGGMGEVYRARDSRLGRDVAVKVLPEHLSSDAQALKRFEREARAVAALSHPNILALYDVGCEQGISYVVTELLEGENLRTRLVEGSFNRPKAIEVAVALAEGLSAAHSRGVTHRDLKPENIFITADGVIKILDFGLAHYMLVSCSQAADAPTETETGRVMGTVGYMSPEQIRGEPVDARSDIFSLGCVLYELFSGRRAFAGHSPCDTLAATLREDPSPLPDPDIQRLIAHCLEKKPVARFQTVRDLIFVLRSLPTTAARHRAPRRGVPSPIESLAVLPFLNVAGDPSLDYLTDGVPETLTNTLSQQPKLRVVPRSRAFRYKDPQVDPVQAGRELGVHAVLTGRVALRGESLNIQVELVDVAEDSQLWGEQFTRRITEMQAIQDEITRAVAVKLRLQPAGEATPRAARNYTDNTEAYQLYLKGRYRWNRRTEETLQSSVEYFQQAIEKDPSYAIAWVGLADAHNLLGTYAVRPPAETFPRARTAATRALELDPDLAEAHVSVGWMKSQFEWDWVGAEKAYRRAIELNPDYATTHHWYAWYLATVGRRAEAVESVRRGPDLDPESPVIHSRVGLFLYFARRHEEAVEECRKSIAMDPTFAWGHDSLGSAYMQIGRQAEGIAELEKGFSLSQRGVIEFSYLGHAYAVAGREAEARKLLAELDDLSTKRYVPPFYVAVICLGLGDKAAALGRLEKAVAERSLPSWYLPDLRLDSLRPDPRFKELLRRMGLSNFE